MTIVWNKIEDLANKIEQKFKQTGEPFTNGEHEFNWYNALYSSLRYRRAHIEIVDHREKYGIYILHSTIFPHFNDPSPIWGFDAVCGQNKITGAFHDFSLPGIDNHPMSSWWQSVSQNRKWNKSRQLPEWARQIFSKNMVAAGNVFEGEELDNLCNLAIDSLDYYLLNVGLTQESGSDFHQLQNKYCYYQKQNPHVINSMVAMGIPRETMEKFVDKILFPEII